MGRFIVVLFLPGMIAIAWLFARRPVKRILEELYVDQARALFRQEREWLEARFLSALARQSPDDRARWENARWQNELHLARDRKTRVLLALVGVSFESLAFDIPFESSGTTSHATALFEYRKGRWITDGKRLDAVKPAEAFTRNQRFEPVVPSGRGAVSR